MLVGATGAVCIYVCRKNRSPALSGNPVWLMVTPLLRHRSVHMLNPFSLQHWDRN